MAVDAAADVTVIDRQTIEQSGAVSVPDLLRTEANVLVRGTTGTGMDGQISMRGFGDNSHLRTLVLVDGHRLNSPDMGAMDWQSVPLSNIERVEVVRGGQNVLYGDRAVGGVVKITTKRGAEAGTRIGASIGSFGYVGGSLGHGGALGDVDYYAGLDGYELDGFRDHSSSRGATLSGSMTWYAGDADTLSLRTSYTDSFMQFPGALSYDQMKADPTQSISGQGESDMRSSLNSLLWEGGRSWGAVRIATGLNVRDLDWELDGLYGRNFQTGYSFGPRVRLGSEVNFFMTGVDGSYDSLDFDDLHPDDPRYRRAWAELERLTFSPYVFAQRKLSAKTTVNGGARHEHARTDNLYVDYVDNQVLPFIELGGIGLVPNPDYKNPPDTTTNSFAGIISKDGWAAELSLIQDINENWSAWIGYDRLYRYPVLDEVASYQGFPLSDPLNQDLDPETGNEFEVGLDCSAEQWKISCSSFYMMMDNEIVFDDVANLNRNIGSTRRAGLDAELAMDREWYGAGIRWAFQDARLRGGANDGNRVPLVPWMYGTGSVWVDPAASVRLTLTYSYVSEQYQGNDEENVGRKMDAYGLLAVRADIAVTDYAQIGLAVNNLLDEVYATSAYGGAFYPGAGRSFMAGLTLEF